ncbi:MAG: hypothetical protein H7Z74_12640 [Anaerolineae bacterium]|nr:hypothetical protein [Gemmatimonadaceae bacterium]
MPELLIHLTKRADGSSLLRCVRADGSVTWQRHHGHQAAFFPLHDLTHFAVESELAFRDGFYGLLAAGWSMEDTGGKSGRGPLPNEALAVEHIVGMLDLERAGGTTWTAAEFNQQAAGFAIAAGRSAPRALTDIELTRVRLRVRELFQRWHELPDGATLALGFDRAAEGVDEKPNFGKAAMRKSIYGH